MTVNEANEIFTTTERDPLSVRLLKESHILIGGTTGSGKSTMINTFLHTVATYATWEISYCIIDLKMVSLLPWKNDPHCQRYADTAKEAKTLLKDYRYTMMDRFDEMKKKGVSEWKGQHFYLIVDECAELLDNVPGAYDILKDIARLGRAASMHLLLATQSPNRRTIPADLTLNITGLLALRCRSAIESRQITGYKGAEELPRYGQGLYVCPELTTPETVNIRLTSDDDIDKMITAYKCLQDSVCV